MSRKVAAVILTTLTIAGHTLAQSDPVVATVNGVKIKKSEFDKNYAQNLLFVSDKVVTKDKVINDMINKVLGIQRAKKAKLDQDKVVKDKMEEVLYHAQISKDLEPRLSKIVVTDEDVKNYYRTHPEYRTAHILLRVKASPSKNQAMAAQAKALEIYNTLKKAPEKFGELANRYSQSSTAPGGGDMGFQPAIRMAPEYFKAIKGKPDNYITSPVRSQFGYHVVKVLSKKDFSAINSTLYKKIVYDRKRDAILKNYFNGLQKNAKINIVKKYMQYEDPK